MSEIVLFKPKAEISACENLAGFIDVARNRLKVLGEDLVFDDDEWDLSSYINLKARRASVRAVFSDWDTAGSRTSWVAMPEPFLSFAKAYFRYMHGMRPTKAFTQRLAVLRALCKALSEFGVSDIARIDEAVLNRASQLLRSNFEEAGAYRASVQLQILSEFLDENCLVTVPLQWTQPIPRPKGINRVGMEFQARRNEKLPSPEALDALAKVYSLADDPVTELVSSMCALMICAPDRVNEVISLRVDCEHWDIDKNGQPLYGLRYWPSKGGEPQVKWIIPSMATLCQEALSRIRRLTEEGRRIAKWYEQNPNLLYLPAELESFRGRDELAMSEVANLLFVDPQRSNSGYQWCISNGIPLRTIKKRKYVSFKNIEPVLLARLPIGFPMLDGERKLKYSESMCVIPANFLHSGRPRYRSLIAPMGSDDINSRLGGRLESGIESIFSRFEFKEIDGTPIRITTHQFRHYLNTLAQGGGLSEIDIAKWSGRKDLRQNRAYDHVSGRDLLASMQEQIGNESMVIGPLATLSRAALIPRSEFLKLHVPSAHTTEFGYCVHNFAFSPCQLHHDCLNCNELVCVKGDLVREENLRHMLAETRSLLHEAELAVQDGEFGAGRWYEHQKRTVNRVEELLSLIENPSVAQGGYYPAFKCSPRI
nr:integrase [Pseudomonas aeruginosa]